MADNKITFGQSINRGQQDMPNNLTYSQMTTNIYGVDKPDIAKFMYEYNDKNRPQFNDYWFNRSDDSIIENIEQIILSCQRDKYFMLKVLNFEVIKDYAEIQQILYDYYAVRSKKNGKKIDNPYDFIDLRDSDIMLLKVKYYIKLNLPEDKIRIDTKTGKQEQSEGEVDVLIMLPRYVNKYYFRIQGNYYCPMFQIVDGSTYNNATSNSKIQSITLKTPFMPIKVYKEYNSLTDCIDNTTHRCVLFTSYVFTKKTDAIKFILGRFGYYGTQEFLELDGIYVTQYREDENGKPIPIMNPENYYHFASDVVSSSTSSNKEKKKENYERIMVVVGKRLFDKDNITQSFVYTILKNGCTFVMSDYHPFQKTCKVDIPKRNVEQAKGNYFDTRIHSGHVPYFKYFSLEEQEQFPMCQLRFYTLSEIFNAMIGVGFLIEEFYEHPKVEGDLNPFEFTIIARKSI